MRRIIMILFVCVSLSVFAQVGYNIRTGYRGFVEHQQSLGWGYSPQNERLSTRVSSFVMSHGYQFNSNCFVGVGYSWGHCKERGAFTETKMPNYWFLDFRYDRTFSDWFTPYADLKVGRGTRGSKGLCVQPSIGYRIPVYKRLGLNVGIGALIRWSDINNYSVAEHGNVTDITYLGSSHKPFTFLNFTAGIEF